MRPIPDWKWRRNPLVKIYGKYESTRKKLKHVCISNNDHRVVDSIMNSLKEHLIVLFNRRELTQQQIYDIYDDIYTYQLPDQFLMVYRLFHIPNTIDPADKQVWDSLMFEARISKYHSNK